MIIYARLCFTSSLKEKDMDDIFEHTLLYDFYGELLSKHQREVYEDAVFNDLSLSEVAEVYGISRQGAHDLIKRVNRLLAGYEEKLHMVELFRKVEALAEEISGLAAGDASKKALTEIKKRADQITGILG